MFPGEDFFEENPRICTTEVYPCGPKAPHLSKFLAVSHYEAQRAPDMKRAVILPITARSTTEFFYLNLGCIHLLIQDGKFISSNMIDYQKIRSMMQICYRQVKHVGRLAGSKFFDKLSSNVENSYRLDIGTLDGDDISGTNHRIGVE